RNRPRRVLHDYASRLSRQLARSAIRPVESLIVRAGWRSSAPSSRPGMQLTTRGSRRTERRAGAPDCTATAMPSGTRTSAGRAFQVDPDVERLDFGLSV